MPNKPEAWSHKPVNKEAGKSTVSCTQSPVNLSCNKRASMNMLSDGLQRKKQGETNPGTFLMNIKGFTAVKEIIHAFDR
jgi:hypothetical protein